MTIINPNSIAGITSVTAEAGVMNFYKSDGTLAGLQLNGVNFNTTTGISTFNDVYVGGTITYEDVKNVDSVGIITARDHINIVTDNKKLQLGAGQDLTLYHDGSNSWITNSTGVLVAGSADFQVANVAGNEQMIRAYADGAVNLYYDNALKFSTASSGVNIVGTTTTGQLSVTGVSTFTGDVDIADSIIHTGDTDTKIRFPAADTVTVETAGSERLRIKSDGSVGVGTVTPIGQFHLHKASTSATQVLECSSGAASFQVRHTNGYGTVNFWASGTEKFRIGQTGTSSDFNIYDVPNSAERLRITSGGLLLLGTTDTGFSSGYTTMTIGNTSTSNTGLTIASSASNGYSRLHFADGTSGAARYAGWIAYNHADDQLLFSTGNSGSSKLILDSSGRVLIGTTSADDTSQKLKLHQAGNDHCLLNLNVSSSSYSSLINFGDSGSWSIGQIAYAHSDDSLRFKVNAGERLRIDSSGNVTVKTTDVTFGGAGILRINSGSTAGALNLDGGSTNHGGEINLTGGSNGGRIQFRTGQGSGQQSEKMRLDETGRLLIGTTTEGHADADNLTIADTNPGITLRSATNGAGSIFFSDATSGIAEYDGFVQFYHNDKHFRLGINNDEKLRITSGGTLVLGDSDNASASGLIHLYQASNDPYIYIQRGSGDSATTIGGIFFKNSTNNLGLISVRSSDINDGSMKFSTMNAGTLGEKLIIQPSGNLDVYANTVHLYNSTDTSNTYFYAQNTGAGNAGIKMKNNQGEWTIIANDRLRFIDDDASLERFSIENDGNLKVWNGGRITILSANNNGQTSTLLKIGSQGNGTETRAIDMDGGWSTSESKSITYTHGSGASDMIAQMNVQYYNPGSQFRWGKLYHSGNSSTYTMFLKSISTTTAELKVAGHIVANSNPSTHIPLASKALQSNTSCYTGESSGSNTAYSLLPWSNGGTYIASGTYYDNSSWVHRSNDNSNCLLYFKSSGWQWYASNNGSTSWNLASSVGVMNSSGEWTGGTSSDRRLKDNITNMSTSDALTKVSQLQGVSYTWKDAIQKKFGIGPYPEGTHYGFIAQDVKTVWPEAHIITQSDNESDFDEDPTHDIKDDVYYGEIEGVKMEKMIPLLVEAIKELKNENDALKARVTTLESS